MSVSYIPFSFPQLSTVRCIFQTRPGGESSGAYAGGNISFSVGDEAGAVEHNRRSLLASLCPAGLTAWAELTQVHGDALLFEPEALVESDFSGCAARPVREGDGMAATRPGLGLLIKTADCQPILLAHKDGGHIAALHVGWRGNRCNFPASAVARFCAQYGLEPRHLLAVRGPSLGPARAEFIHFDEEWGEAFRPWFDPATQSMDLWSLTRHQLQEAGLLARHIYGLDLCTAGNNASFFSYRQEKASGRQASVIWIAGAQS